MIVLESRHEAVANAVESMAEELGLDRLSFSCWPKEGNFYAHGDYGDLTESALGDSPATALKGLVEKLNALIANPPAKVLRDAPAVKEAISAIVAECRAEISGEMAAGPVLDDIADRIEALQVKG